MRARPVTAVCRATRAGSGGVRLVPNAAAAQRTSLLRSSALGMSSPVHVAAPRCAADCWAVGCCTASCT